MGYFYADDAGLNAVRNGFVLFAALEWKPNVETAAHAEHGSSNSCLEFNASVSSCPRWSGICYLTQFLLPVTFVNETAEVSQLVALTTHSTSDQGSQVRKAVLIMQFYQIHLFQQSIQMMPFIYRDIRILSGFY